MIVCEEKGHAHRARVCEATPLLRASARCAEAQYDARTCVNPSGLAETPVAVTDVTTHKGGRTDGV